MSELNNIKIECGAIKQNGETVFEGFQVNLNLTDKSYETEATSLLKALPMFLELASNKISAAMEADAKRHAERKATIEKENEAMLKDWEERCKEFEKEKAEFEKKHAAWEKRDKNNESFDPEPTFYKEKPSRPHLHVY